MIEHSLASLCQRSHDISKSKGWLENPRPFSAICALIHSEISEALEDFRNNRKLDETYYELTHTPESSGISYHTEHKEPPGKPCGIPIELADVVIRVAQWCGTNGKAEELHKRVAFCEGNHKWFSRYVTDIEDFSAKAHHLTSKAYAAWDDGQSPETTGEANEREMILQLADLTHLCFAFSRVNNIDLWAAIDEKEAFNKTRPHKHGNKRI